MNQDKHIYISIYLYQKGYVPAGVITFNDDAGYAGFSYLPSYMEANHPPLNPSTLNYRDGTQRHFLVNTHNNPEMMDRTFWEMIPNKNDWATQVILSKYPLYSAMNGVQKLYFLGSRAVGGLSSYVKNKTYEESVDSVEWLDKIRGESIDLYMHNISKITNIKAINPLTSYGGARPKCMFVDEQGEHWIAKFNLPTDPYDMALAEHVALSMSQDCGLRTAIHKVITLPSGDNVFLSKRFDRDGENRLHTLPLFALAPGNEVNKKNNNAVGIPGGFIQKLIRRYSDFKDQDTVNIVTKLLLDIGVNNTDNHLKNLRLILNREGKWELSPIYDVVFNPYSQPHVCNPAGLPLEQLYLENPDLISSLSNELQIEASTIEKKLKTVKEVTSNWESYCNKVGMNKEDQNKIGNAISLGKTRQEYNNNLVKEQERNIINVLNIPKPKNRF